jgi:hypothetical protein
MRLIPVGVSRCARFRGKRPIARGIFATIVDAQGDEAEDARWLREPGRGAG